MELKFFIFVQAEDHNFVPLSKTFSCLFIRLWNRIDFVATFSRYKYKKIKVICNFIMHIATMQFC